MSDVRIREWKETRNYVDSGGLGSISLLRGYEATIGGERVRWDREDYASYAEAKAAAAHDIYGE